MDRHQSPEEILRRLVSVSGSARTVFASAMLTGIAAHFYLFANKLPNADDVGHINAYGQGARVGRWFLELMGEIVAWLTGNYSMPFFNGMLCLFLLALAAVETAELFEIRDRACCIFLGGLFTCFPAVTDTMLFLFTAPFYGAAILLAVLAAKWMIAGGKKQIAGMLLLILSAATYQAYYPLCAAILAGKVIQKTMQDRQYPDIRRVILEAFRYAALFLAGIAGYLLSVLLPQRLNLVQMVSYRGADDMGGVLSSFHPIAAAALAYQKLAALMTTGYVGLTEYRVLRCLFAFAVAAMAVGAAGKAILFWRRKQAGRALWLLLLLLLYPPVVFSLFFSGAAGGSAYALMLFPVLMFYVLPLVGLEELNNAALARKNGGGAEAVCSVLNGLAVCAMGAVLVLYCRFSNEYYLWMQMDLNQAYSYSTALISRIRSCEGYQATDRVVLLGEIDDRTLTGTDQFQDVTMEDGSGYLLHVYSFPDFLKYYCGFNQMDQGLAEEAARWPQTVSMPVWPNDGSIRRLENGVIVVKLSDPSQQTDETAEGNGNRRNDGT